MKMYMLTFYGWGILKSQEKCSEGKWDEDRRGPHIRGCISELAVER